MQHQPDFLDAISEVQGGLEVWRASKSVPRRIPPEIWGKAVRLASVFGVGRVSQALRLGYTELKRKMPSHLPVARTAQPAFLELISAPPSVIEYCSFELENSRGTKIRLELKGVPASGLATLIREVGN
jgi:hypothetical protein